VPATFYREIAREGPPAAFEPTGRRHTVGQVAAGIAFAILAATTLSVFGIGPRSSRTSVAVRLDAALLLLVAALLLLSR
jgi:hypothetical protein